ncbi:MAG TPA: NUDIX domain-containing protein [Candidatus Thermoplasmatota archaeon]|nr:NUDIX domain-containing protein [Candidatus Thermoplasmatota archaeon]
MNAEAGGKGPGRGSGKGDAMGQEPVPTNHPRDSPGLATNSPARKEYTVVVAIRDGEAGKEFLMVEHKERGWELPGGKLEGLEGPVHCALREFREETGHLLSSPRFVMKLRKGNGTCFVFTGGLGTAVGGDPDPSVAGYRWFHKLPRGAKLAFPDDPYAEMGAKLGIDFG